MLLQVSENECTRCGICIEACPLRIIEMTEADAVPSPTSDAEERCIKCGHCVAVCPHGAISLDSMPVDSCPSVRKEWFPEPEHFEHFLRARRSIRCFTDENVEKSVLSRLIEAGRHAPTGSNSQQVGWLIVYEREKVETVASMTIDFLLTQAENEPSSDNSARIKRIVQKTKEGYDYICRGAPHLILAHAPELRGPTDCVIALTYLELAAFSLGIGPCWAGYVGGAAANWPPLRKFLGVPDGRRVSGAILLGKPKYEYRRLPLRNEATVTWLD